MVPVPGNPRGYGLEGVVNAHSSALTVWAVGAACPLIHRSLPDVGLACWALVAGPLNLSDSMGRHLDAIEPNVVVGMPFLLKLGAQLADVRSACLDVAGLFPNCLAPTHVSCTNKALGAL